jgi:aryl-alcohol dehydrogenase-like predicted oxidoreductase
MTAPQCREIPAAQAKKAQHRRHNLYPAAAEAGATPAQIALAWLLAQGHDIAPIPGHPAGRQR